MKTKQDNVLIRRVLIALLLSFVMTACIESGCGDQLFVGQFYLVDQTTGLPYFTGKVITPDSVKLYRISAESKQPYPVPIVYRKDDTMGYIFSGFVLEPEDVLFHVALGAMDVDTLLLKTESILINKRCRHYKLITSPVYNGRPLGRFASDTTKAIRLIK